MPTRRQERVNARLVQEISQILYHLRDDRLGFTTVLKAEVSPDMRHANVFVSILGDEEAQDRGFRALQDSTHHIRMQLGKVMQMKSTPRIHFRFDDGIKTADEISRLIDEARASDPHPPSELHEDGEPTDTAAPPAPPAPDAATESSPDEPPPPPADV